MDITDAAAVRDLMDLHRADLVMNAAAYIDVDGAECDEDCAFARVFPSRDAPSRKERFPASPCSAEGSCR